MCCVAGSATLGQSFSGSSCARVSAFCQLRSLVPLSGWTGERRRTVVVGADVQHARLATRNGLREPEQRRAQRGDPLRGKHLGGVEGGPRGGDLDAVPLARDARAGELGVVEAGVVERLLGAVGVRGEGLQEDAAADGVDVLLAHEDGLGVAPLDIVLSRLL